MSMCHLVEYEGCELTTRVAYNHAKPFAFHGDDPGRFGRKFLQHPLSNLDDSRFVVSVELQAGRGESST
jgi:hypothetical protein